MVDRNMTAIQYNTVINGANVLNDPKLLSVFQQLFKNWNNLYSPTFFQAVTTIYLTVDDGKGVIALSTSVSYGFNNDY